MSLCTICSEFRKAFKIDESSADGITWLVKLQNIAPEVDWDEQQFICEHCTLELLVAYKFREKCLHAQSHILKVECNYVEENDSSKDEFLIDSKEASIVINGGLTCFHCNEKSTTKQDLIRHIQDNHPNRNYEKYKRNQKCPKCGRKYVSDLAISEHLTLCDGITRHCKTKSEHQCTRCGKYYTSNKILTSHTLKCNENLKKTNFQCTNCNKYYISSRNLKLHQKSHCKRDDTDTTTILFCKFCDETFQSQLLLKEHVMAQHKAPRNHCDIFYPTLEGSKPNNTRNELEHKYKESKNRKVKFTCEVCNEQFILLKEIIEHCVTVHSMDLKSIRPYMCEICSSRFRRSTNLVNHKLYHNRDRPNICSLCGKSFITKNDLTAHENIHYTARNYKCDKCEKAFKTNTNLRTHHLIVHTNPLLWKYVCGICSKRFPQKSNYDQHLRRHIGEKKFICPLCKKAFTSKSEMQEHVRYHSNLRAFKCDHCGKEYRKKHTYNVHLTKIHGIGNAKIRIAERKYACHICPGRFCDKQKLQRHLCTHTGLKPYACHSCDKKFSDKSYLKHHLKVAHNIIEPPAHVFD